MDLEQQLRVERLLARYVHVIDDDRLEEWPALFVEDGSYRVTTAENFQRGLPLSIIAADSRAMLRDRVSALRHANIYEAQRYRHAVSSILVEPVDRSVVQSRSTFMVVRTMQNGDAMIFATGRYHDRIRLHGEGGEPQFEERVVILDSRVIDTLLAIPL